MKPKLIYLNEISEHNDLCQVEKALTSKFQLLVT